MLRQMINQDFKLEANYMISMCEEFEQPILIFALMKITGKGIRHVWGVFDLATSLNYIVIVQKEDIKVIESSKIQYPKETSDIFELCLEYYILNLMNEGYTLGHMEFIFHTKMWEFIDEFIDDVNKLDKGLYAYLSYCKETGINYDILKYHAELSSFEDLLIYFYQKVYKGDTVILYQPIINQFLLLNVCYDENDGHYYKVLLLNSKHEIIEKNCYSKLESAINDFNNKFYDLKIEEHRKCDKQIKCCIEEHISFLKERNEKI
ncbi:hypothetical protein MKC86_08230 [[Clostridium] innocuum]|nr:hypothetical protein [[Clostridium] innocuum]